MKRIITFVLFAVLVSVKWASAAVVTTVPAILQEDSENVKIIFDATQGTGGMVGATDCYAHTGCTLNGGPDWQHAPTWGDNSAKYKLTSIGTNLWQLDMGNMRDYYGITDPNQHITKLAFVFRNGTKTKEGKDTGGADIYVEVHPAGLAVQIATSLSKKFVNAATSVPLTVSASTAADLKVYLNNVGGSVLGQKQNATELSFNYSMSSVGNYRFIAEATLGSKVERDTLVMCYRPNSQSKTFSGKLYQGATQNSDGSVTFCLLAPNKTNVMLVGEWNNFDPDVNTMMNYQTTDANGLSGKFFWVTVNGLDRNKEYGYYYLVDDNLIVADPYAKMIQDPWNDKYINETMYPGIRPFPQEKVGTNVIAVYKGNIDDYNWEVTDFQTPDRGDLVIYELLVRDFTDEGTITAATNKLPYLERLGINAIELMPVQEFSGNDSWGYNPTFYMAADKAYGTAKAYRRFIDECHKRGIAVILDVVFNHVWGDHPWAKLYWNSSTNKPTSANPFLNVDAPHDFSVGNDWKQESPYVRQYFADILKYWTKEYKIDGYRFDLAKGYGDSNSYSSGRDAYAYNSSRIENEKRFINAARSVNPRAVLIFESFVSSSEENAIGAAGGMSWRQMMQPSQQQVGMYQSNSDLSGYNDPSHYWVSYPDSHDEERLGYWAKTYSSDKTVATYCKRIGAMAALGFLSRGAKMLYEFDEMGYDIALGNDDAKMRKKDRFWNKLTDASRRGLYDSWCEILSFRKANPDLFNSSAQFYPAYAYSNWSDGRFITARNSDNSKELIVAVNVTNAQKTFSYTFSKTSGYYINSKSYGTNPSFNASSSTITVPAHGYVIISNMAHPFTLIEDISDLNFTPDVVGIEDVVIDNNEAEAALRIYPNPATDIVTVDAGEVSLIEVYSLWGGLMASQANGNQINISDLAPGTYILRATTANGARVAKLIKK